MKAGVLITFLLALLAVSCQKVELGDTIDDKNVVDDSSVPMPQPSLPQYSQNQQGLLAILCDSVSIPGSVRITYISRKEWDGISSSYSQYGTEALRLAEMYNEGGVYGWHVPTRDDARRMVAEYSYIDFFNALNAQLESAGAMPMTQFDKYTDKAYRYLCGSNVDSTFVMHKSYGMLKAGATVTYHLRLVKDSIINKNGFAHNDSIHFEFKNQEFEF